MNNLILYKLQSTKGSKIAEALLLNELPIKEYIKNKVNVKINNKNSCFIIFVSLATNSIDS